MARKGQVKFTTKQGKTVTFKAKKPHPYFGWGNKPKKPKR